QGEKAAVGIKRELRGDGEIAAHIIAQKRLVAFGRPFNRPSDALGAPGHQGKFGKEAVARAKIAAYLAGDDAHGFLGQAENASEFTLMAHNAAGTGIERDATALRVVDADSGAWLYRHTGDSIDPGIEPCDVSGFRECSLDGRGVADFSVDYEIGDIVIKPRRVGRERGFCVGYRPQYVVLDDNAFGSVFGCSKGLGDNEGDGGAHITNAVGEQ